MRFHYGGRTRVVMVIPIPASTERTTIMPYSLESNTFDANQYIPTDNTTSDEVSKFLTEVEDLLSKYQRQATSKCIKYIQYLPFVAFIATAVAIFLSITGKTVGGIPIVFPFMALFFISVFVMAIVKCFDTSRDNKNIAEAKQNVQALIHQRAAFFKARGLNWILPTYFPRWIELWKDQNQNLVPPMQYAPMQYGNGIMMGQPTSPVGLLSSPNSGGPLNNSSYDQVYNSFIRPGQTNPMPNQQGLYTQNQYAGNIYNST